jgi:hypothetical protein|tara:strand:+ start:295 stop:453 length:159 start_codon:yes stop_codon:yes gene_type:complete
MTEESKNKESKTTILQGVLRMFSVRKKKKKSLVWLHVLLNTREECQNKFRRR